MRWPFQNIPRAESRAALLAFVASTLLMALKFFAYYLTSSAAIFADALESIVNVAAATFALYSLQVAHRPADAEHPYGHGKIEFFSAGFEGGMILLASVVAAAESVNGLLHGGLRQENLTAGVLILSMALFVNGFLGLYLVRTARKSGSLTLEADGKHLLSDAITSVVALAALLLVRLTHRAWVDPVAGLIAAVYISGIGIALVRHAAGGLMDRQDVADERLLRQILDAHLGPGGKEPHVCSYHKLRHRHSGRYHWVDFHIMVPAHWDVAHGHQVASAIEYEIELALGEGNATAHVEPCPDALCKSCHAA